MSIRVVCPNGHELNVKDSFAGKSGLCPMCKARVSVPLVSRAELSEDAILRILGSHEAGRSRNPIGGNGQAAAESSPTSSDQPRAPARPPAPAKPPKKTCIQCDREIDAATHICPFCHTYIAGLKDF
jgi:hypothetical protein